MSFFGGERKAVTLGGVGNRYSVSSMSSDTQF